MADDIVVIDTEEEETIVDNGASFVSSESAEVAEQAARDAKLWAQESERQALLAIGSAEDAASARDDAVAAKEYAESAITDTNLIVVATDLQSTPSFIKTVVNNISDVNAVGSNISNVNAVADNETNINAVNSNKTNINKVATDINRVKLVADDIASVDAVAIDISNIIDVASDLSNIDSVAGDLTNINAVAADLTNINNASSYADLAKDWAVKMNGLVGGEDYSAKYWADQARQSASGAVVDNVSITRNTDDELQTIGVINQNSTTTALKQWSGTRAQYDAIVTKDSNTLYNITDDTDVTLSLLEAIYPVGSVYIGTMGTCPLATLGIGTWTLVASDRVLQGSGTIGDAGDTVEAGLPDHNHVASKGGINISQSWSSGNILLDNTSHGTAHYTDNASASNPIYGNSDTVQPPAYIVNIWERTA